MVVRNRWCFSSALCIAGAVAILSGCSNLRQPGFGERDMYVVNTPTAYPDNRVFYVGKIDVGTGVTPATPSWKLTPEQMSKALVHNNPLSIIIDAVGLPVSTEKETKDVAIVLDVHAETTAEVRSLVIWYQRGVNPGQTLNFKNLLIHSQEQWDERVAPMFRIRVVDVAAERNAETRETLGQVSKFGGALGALIQNPLAQPIIETATRAASLVLANRANKVMMDYSIQFFSARLVVAAGTPNLTPLLAGRFVLAGRSVADLENENFWRRTARLDEHNTIVQFSDGASAVIVGRSPGVSVQVLNRELIVPAQVAVRSAYLTKLLTDTASVNLEEMNATADALLSDVKTLNLREQIVRYRQITSINNLIASMFFESNSGRKLMPESTRQIVARFMRKISGCSAVETEGMQTWWDKVKAKAAFKTEADFAKDTPATIDVLLKGSDLCKA